MAGFCRKLFKLFLITILVCLKHKFRIFKLLKNYTTVYEDVHVITVIKIKTTIFIYLCVYNIWTQNCT